MKLRRQAVSSTGESRRSETSGSGIRRLAGVAAPVLVALTPFACAGLSAQAASQEQGAAAPIAVGVNLNITPKRLTFNRGERSATVYIFNQGTSPAAFDIAMVDRVMLPTGEIRPLSEAQQIAELQPVISRLKSAQPMVIATPRRAVLAPGKGQTIRIRVTAPAGAEAAEYRSHLTVTTVPPRDAGVTAEQAAAAAQRPDQLSFRITSVFGLSIPVIVRSGTPDVRGGISNVRLTYADISPDGVAPARRTPMLSFDLERAGANSLFGNIEVRTKGAKEPVGLAKGVGVYTEIDRRSMQIPLQRVPQAGEQLEITFVEDDVSPGKIIARTTFVAS
ncbi:MAG TPA: hypothetical protein VNT77_09755 [Allosphingosinicella sp.]|nr:hypothetical protein [Allosphingosinicella sp.]